MENHRRQKPNSTGDIFTFPATAAFESELADQLFSNGKFLLHAFPVQPTTCVIPRSMILSRTSSMSSKDSLMSSRSNSTNSLSSSVSNSSCSSARTSTCSETSSSRRKLAAINHHHHHHTRSVSTNASNSRFPKKELQNRQYCNGNYGHSQRWQFIAPVPVLNRRNSSKKRKGGKGKRDGGVRKGFCRRFFGWLVSTCQECHAIEPSKRLKVMS